MASGIYDRFRANLLQGDCHLDAAGDAIRCALMTAVHAFNAAHNVWADVVANETAGAGYVANGALMAGQAVTQAATSYFDADNTAWGPGASFMAAHAVLYDDTLGGDDLICSFDFGGALTVVAGTFTIQWNVAGIITVT
jgi:hypothetical protein